MNPRLLVTLAALAVILLARPAATFAQSGPPIPPIIEQGLSAYAQTGLDNALDAWLSNSLLDRATLLKNEMAALKFADARYGLFEKGEVMRVAPISSRVTRVYVVLYYERAPLWAWFDLYTTRHGKQVLSEVFFSPKIQVILPPDVLEQ